MNSEKDLVFYKKISLREQNLEQAKSIQETYKVSPVVSRILAARGYESGEELKHYLKPTLKESLSDPQQLKNLGQAANLIADFVKESKSIALCSDFDVDGLTSAAIVKSFLDSIGVRSEVFVPDRFSEGYGLNQNMVREVHQKKHELLITLDYGTTNVSELELAKELGLRTIVIDHHHVQEVPPCDVFVNPEQNGCGFADKNLCTAGLSWYLLIALRKVIPKAAKLDLREYLDLAALGTICDMVPLVGLNRVIALKGLEELGKSSRIGIQALKQVVGVKDQVGSYHVGFGFGPRINAAGRMLHGKVVVDLLTTEDASKANKIAKKLNALNDDRQEVERRIKRRALEKINTKDDLPFGISVWGDNFHTGVIGIVSQRLSETFYRPSAVMGLDNNKYKGSVRGIPGFSVVDALSELKDYFSKFGGHKGAGGFTLKEENPEDFQTAFNDVCKDLLQDVELVPKAQADAEISFDELDLVICDELKTLSPFGVGNAAPLLLIKDLKVKDVKVLKSAHLKVTLTDGKRYHPGLFWHTVRHPSLIQGAKVNIVCKPDLNTYMGETSIQLNLQAVEESR